MANESEPDILLGKRLASTYESIERILPKPIETKFLTFIGSSDLSDSVWILINGAYVKPSAAEMAAEIAAKNS